MSKFYRESRYTVIKAKDAAKYLTRSQRTALRDIEFSLAIGRHGDNKLPLTAVVLEADWPEYEKVWAMIEERSK